MGLGCGLLKEVLKRLYLKEMAEKWGQDFTPEKCEETFDHLIFALQTLIQTNQLPARNGLEVVVQNSLRQALRAFAYALAWQLEPRPALISASRQHFKTGIFNSTPFDTLQAPGHDWVEDLVAEATLPTAQSGIDTDFIRDVDTIHNLLLDPDLNALEHWVDAVFVRWLQRRGVAGPRPAEVEELLREGWLREPAGPHQLAFFVAFTWFCHQSVQAQPELFNHFAIQTLGCLINDLKRAEQVPPPTIEILIWLRHHPGLLQAGWQQWCEEQFTGLKRWLEHPLPVRLSARQPVSAEPEPVADAGNLLTEEQAAENVQAAIEFHSQRLAVARARGDRRSEGVALGNLGNAYIDGGETARAIESYSAALNIMRELGDPHGEGTALDNLGLTYAALGDPHRAIELHEQALLVHRRNNDHQAEGSALGNLGLVHAALGDTNNAITLFNLHLEIARTTGDRQGESHALGNLGNAYAELGNVRQAIELHEQALAIDREIKDCRGEGNELGNLGNAYAGLGQTSKAIQFYEQALVIDQKIGDRRGESNALGNLGLAYFALDDTRRAIKYYEQALVIDREIGDRQGEGVDLWNSALAWDTLGDRMQAIAHAAAALSIFESIEAPNTAPVREQLIAWRNQLQWSGEE